MSTRAKRRLQCSLCQRTFARTEHLTRHERSHRNEKPFSCEHCDARFTRKDLVKVHGMRHHKDILTEVIDHSSVQKNPLDVVPHDEFDPQTELPPFWMFSNITGTYGVNHPLDEFANVDFDTIIGNEVRSSNEQSPAVIQGTSPLEQFSSSSEIAEPVLESLIPSPMVPENPWRTSFDISTEKREQIAQAIRQVILPTQPDDDFPLPSCIAFRRYISTFFDVFLTSLPCIHGPTWRADDQEPALLLAIAAIGASTCGRIRLSLALHLGAQRCMWNYLHLCQFNSDDQPIWVAHTILFIMLFGTYSGVDKIAKGVLAYQSILASIARSMAPIDLFWVDPGSESIPEWANWTFTETVVRTKCAIFVYFSQLHLVMNLPVPLSWSDLNINLPCSEESWHASTIEAWCRYRQQETPSTVRFTDAFQSLVTGKEPEVVGCSPFGAVIMLHATLQHMWHVRQSNLGKLTPDHVRSLEQTLERWDLMWVSGLRQSHLTNKSLPRALELDANALHKSAYFMLYANVHKFKANILSSNLLKDTTVATFVSTVTRTPFAARSAFYSIQIVLMLVNSGFVWISKIMTGAPSLQFHIMSSMHCTLYLSKWLEAIHTIDATTWTADENQVVSLTKATLSEIELAREHLLKPLSVQLLYAWCQIFKNAGQGGIVPVVVQVVQEYAKEVDKCL